MEGIRDHRDLDAKSLPPPRRVAAVPSWRVEGDLTPAPGCQEEGSAAAQAVLSREDEHRVASELSSNRAAFERLLGTLPDPIRSEVIGCGESCRSRAAKRPICDVEARYRRMVALASQEPDSIPRETLEAAGRLAEDVLWARDTLILSNVGFVVQTAKQFEGRKLPLEDLVQEGLSGLLKAVDKYDPRLGRVTTYAKFWIERSIKRALLNQPHTIRRPVHIGTEIGAMLRSSRELEAQLGREPSGDELARTLGVPERRVDELRAIIRDPIALETMDDGEGMTGPLAYVADPKAEDPLSSIARQERIRELSVALDKLGPRERKVIGARFGMDGRGGPWSFQEIGEMLGVSRERTRKIESLALRKLRRILCPDGAANRRRMAPAPQQT